MSTTRIAPSCSPCGIANATRRHRVDPLKLLALIERVKTAAGPQAVPAPQTKPSLSAKAG